MNVPANVQANAPIQGSLNTSTLIQRIETPLIFGTFGLTMLILIVLVITQIYSNIGTVNSITASSNALRDTQTAFIIIAILFVAIILLVLLIPNYGMMKTFLGKFSSTFILLLYLIGLIIFFRDFSSNILNKYSFLIAPITVLIGLFLFYRAFNSGSSSQNYALFDINLARIKYILLYFCFIVFILIFYIVDPGSYVKTYFGPLLVITILLAIFGFLYLITLMTLPSLIKTNTSIDGSTGFFKSLSKIGLYSGIAFIVFLIVVVSGILVYPGGFLTNTNTAGNPKTAKVSGIIIQLIIIFSLWILFFGVLSFRNVSRTQTGEILKTLENYTGIAKQAFLLLFGLIFSCILIGWMVKGANNLNSSSGITSFILNILLLLFILFIIFKLITGGNYYERSPGYRLFVNIILYIPCIFVWIIDKIGSLTGFSYNKINPNLSLSNTLFGTMKNLKETPVQYYTIFGAILLCYFLYFWGIPQFKNNFSKQGGTILVNNPVPTNIQNSIGTYDALNGITNEASGANQYDYQYAISFWVYINADGPSTNTSLTKYTSLLNYGGKPNVLYNATTNTLLITIDTHGSTEDTESKEYDTNGNVILYKLSDVLLQKWNNIIVNYNGGTVDVFYNGQLVKTTLGVVPRMSKDTLTIGENVGINGQICNVNYFNTSLNIEQVYYLYNTAKDKDPPTSIYSNESIVEDVLHGVGVKNPTSFVTTIPINIDVTTINDIPIPLSKPLLNDLELIDPTNIKEMDYISPKWFFKMNGDDYNGL